MEFDSECPSYAIGFFLVSKRDVMPHSQQNNRPGAPIGKRNSPTDISVASPIVDMFIARCKNWETLCEPGRATG